MKYNKKGGARLKKERGGKPISFSGKERKVK